jgi:hypothetical protein
MWKPSSILIFSTLWKGVELEDVGVFEHIVAHIVTHAISVIYRTKMFWILIVGVNHGFDELDDGDPEGVKLLVNDTKANSASSRSVTHSSEQDTLITRHYG